MDGVAGLSGLTTQADCLTRYSHYPPPKPLAQLFFDAFSPIIQQASNADIYMQANTGNFCGLM